MAITKEIINGLINQADPTKRIYPYPAHENAENVRSDPEYFTFNSNRKVKVQDGVRNFKAMITELAGKGAVSPNMIKAIESGQCAELGYFIIGINGDLTGTNGGDEGCSTCGCGKTLENTGFNCVTIQSYAYKLIEVPIYDSTGAKNYLTREDGTKVYPIKIASATLNANYIPAKEKEPAMIAVSFDFDASEKDSNLVTVPCSELGGTYLLTVSGLHNVCAKISNITTTGATVTLKTDYGIPVEGMVAADFISSDSGATSSIFNDTDDADVAISGSDESAPGVYDLTWTAQDPEDELIPYGTLTGFDFTCASGTPIVIPTS